MTRPSWLSDVLQNVGYFTTQLTTTKILSCAFVKVLCKTEFKISGWLMSQPIFSQILVPCSVARNIFELCFFCLYIVNYRDIAIGQRVEWGIIIFNVILIG